MADKIIVKENDVILEVKEISLTRNLNNDYNELTNKPDLNAFLSPDNIIQGNNIILEKNGNNITINSSGGVTDYNELTNKPDLATVATTGNYTDLTNKPNLVAGSNVYLTTSGNDIIINASGGGGGGASLDSNYNFNLTANSAYLTNTAFANILIGYNCGQQVVDKSGNIAIGFQTLKNYPVNNCTAIGYFSSANLTGSFNTSVGQESLGGSSVGNYNTAIGVTALYNTSYSNCTGIGNYAQVTGDNQVQLGNSSTTPYAFASLQIRSDIRDKANIRKNILSRQFILAHEPVQWQWNFRKDYEEIVKDDKGNITIVQHPNDGSKTRKRFHNGFIAQKVQEIMTNLNVDFAGLQHHSLEGGQDIYTIAYEEYISPIVGCIQEQDNMILDLKNEISELKQIVNDLKYQINKN